MNCDDAVPADGIAAELTEAIKRSALLERGESRKDVVACNDKLRQRHFCTQEGQMAHHA